MAAKLDIRTEARSEAKAILIVERPGKVNFYAIVEKLDTGEFAHLGFKTLEGAVRAAARELGRKIDADGYILPAAE